MPENTVSVARPTRWGNPFGIVEYGRRESLRLFAGIVDGCWSPDLVAHYSDASSRVVYDLRCAWVTRLGGSVHERIRSELRGMNLACWCGLHEACHADILLRIAND